jgi:transposase
MLTQEDDVEIHALASRGWSLSAIARHTGRDRKTIRRYLAGEGGAQQDQAEKPSCLDPYRPYITARFEDDPHLLLSVLHRELAGEGFGHCYSSLVKEVRRLELRPICPSCKHCRDKAPTIEIDHPPGEEIQWDWLELEETPWGQKAYVLVGALSHSGRFRAVFCEQTTLGHLAAAIHPILVGLGGSARSWRTDRMATAVIPGTDRLNPRFGELAKHYGADVAICPPYRPQRKGVVESAIKYLTRSWWRSARVETPSLAQGSLERWCADVADRRRRGKTTVAGLAAQEPLRPLPPLPFPARIEVERVVSRSALVAFESNHYSVPAAYARRRVIVSTAVGEPALRIATATGELIATHRMAPAGAEQRVRTASHAAGLERAVLAAFTTKAPCRKKQNRPPSERALAELAALHGHDRAAAASLEQYAQLAEAV